MREMLQDFTRHRASPEVSLETYVRRMALSFGEALAPRAAIYLDTKFWILLRLAAAGRGTCSASSSILSILRRQVAEGRVFCPIGEAVFLELMKQTDRETRLATAALIDELSLGATLIDSRTRVGTEVAYFLYSRTGQHELYPIEHLVWSKLSYVLGQFHPTGVPVDAATELAMQKTFFDRMWATVLYEIVSATTPEPIEVYTSFDRTARKLNQGNAAHADEIRSFQGAYSAEVRGAVDLVGDIAFEVMQDMARKARIVVPLLKESERQRHVNWLKNLLAFSLERDRGRDVLRTLHIEASLHASLRWNRGRKLVANDLLDFNHASAAIAYCDAFLTERSLQVMTTEQHLALDKRYDCRVISDPEDAVSYLQAIS